MKKTSATRQPGLLATKMAGDDTVAEWTPIRYNEKEIGVKYEIIQRKHNGIHRLKLINNR